MKPEDQSEIRQIRLAIQGIMETLAAQKRNLDAKTEDLRAKEANLKAKETHLNLLTSQVSAANLVLMALQQIVTADPAVRAAYGETLAEVRRAFHDRLLFTQVPDQTREEYDEALKRIVDPSLHSHLR